MKSKVKISILSGVLAVALVSLLLGPLNLLSSETREAADCGPIELTQLAYDNVVCENGNPNINAEQDLLDNSPQIMSLEPNATPAQIQNAFCSDAIKDDSNGQVSLNAYEYKYVLNRWEKKHKSSELIGNLLDEGKYCGDYYAARDEYRLANITMEERYTECVYLKQSMGSSYVNILKSLMKDDSELWAWFIFTNSIKEDRRSFLTEGTIDLINVYKQQFDKYQIYQCELNFPILKEPVLQSNGQQEAPWYPSAIV